MKEKTLTDYRNRRFQQPYAHALTACSAVVEAPFWSSEARLAELESLTSENARIKVLNYCPDSVRRRRPWRSHS